MKIRAVLFLALIGMCFNPNLSEASNREVETLMIADFEDESVLDLMDTTAVSVSLTDKDVVTGKRALEVRVKPFAVHKCHWPRIVFATDYIKTPIDGSRYSKISTTIRNDRGPGGSKG